MKRRTSPNSFDIIVVGGGLFGVTTALRLARQHTVLLVERQNDLLLEASYINQNRIHFGFHYPRSPETTFQCLDGYELFQERFARFLRTFENYYGVLAKDSLTSPEDYLAFAEKLRVYKGVYHNKVAPDPWFLHPGACALLLAVDEPVIDMQQVREDLKKESLDAKNLTVSLNTTALSIEKSHPFVLVTSTGKYKSDYMINASYGNLNWHNHPAAPIAEIQYVEMVEVESSKKLPGITMMDGPQGLGILPLGASEKRYWWYSVSYSVHMRVETKNNLSFRPPLYSNWDRMYEQGKQLFTFMDEVKYIKSHFVPRTFFPSYAVDVHAARPSLIMKLDHNFYQILSGKLITSMSVAEEMERILHDAAVSNVQHLYDASNKRVLIGARHG